MRKMVVIITLIAVGFILIAGCTETKSDKSVTSPIETPAVAVTTEAPITTPAAETTKPTCTRADADLEFDKAVSKYFNEGNAAVLVSTSPTTDLRKELKAAIFTYDEYKAGTSTADKKRAAAAENKVDDLMLELIKASKECSNDNTGDGIVAGAYTADYGGKITVNIRVVSFRDYNAVVGVESSAYQDGIKVSSSTTYVDVDPYGKTDGEITLYDTGDRDTVVVKTRIFSFVKSA